MNIVSIIILIYIFPLQVTNKLQSWFSINSYIKGYWTDDSSAIKKGWCSITLQWPISCASPPTKEKCQRNRGPRYVYDRSGVCFMNILCLPWSIIQ